MRLHGTAVYGKTSILEVFFCCTERHDTSRYACAATLLEAAGGRLPALAVSVLGILRAVSPLRKSLIQEKSPSEGLHMLDGDKTLTGQTGEFVSVPVEGC